MMVRHREVTSHSRMVGPRDARRKGSQRWIGYANRYRLTLIGGSGLSFGAKLPIGLREQGAQFLVAWKEPAGATLSSRTVDATTPAIAALQGPGRGGGGHRER